MPHRLTHSDFTSPVISVVGAAEIDETSNTDSGSRLVGSPQYGSARAHLKSDAVEGAAAKNRSKGACHSLILNKAAPSTTGIDQSSSIEPVSDLTIVGRCVLQQLRVLRRDVMIQSPGDLRLGA